MPQSELFHKYLEQCFDRLLKSLQGYVDTGENKLLFRFRICIKKIRTCLDCIEFHFGNNEFHKERRQFRKMFRSGGKLRELHLYQAWLKKNHFLRLARSIHVDAQAGNKEKRFLHTSSKMSEEILSTKQVAMSYTGRLSQEEVYKYYIHLLPECLVLTGRKQPGKKEWHRLRKRLKRILYARHWQDKSGQIILSKRQAVYLDQLQHLFGYWHDNEDRIVWLREEQKKHFKRSSKRQRDQMMPTFRAARARLEEAGRKYEQRVGRKLLLSHRIMKPFEQRLKNAG